MVIDNTMKFNRNTNTFEKVRKSGIIIATLTNYFLKKVRKVMFWWADDVVKKQKAQLLYTFTNAEM